MSLPEHINGVPVETWAIERFLDAEPLRENERTIADAITAGDDAVAVAKRRPQGGMSLPGNAPSVFWDSTGVKVWAGRDRGVPPALVINHERIVEYVRQYYVEQQALF